jgi:tetratricopeptide (TPR) repeat protein
MFRKNYFTFLFTIVLFLACGSVAFAQNAPVYGTIEVEKANGSKAPVAGALIQVYREDAKIKLPKDTTDKKGNFAFAGLALGFRYVLAVSGPGISPMVYPNVPPGQPAFTITVKEGDGKQFTEDEVRQILKDGKNTSNTTSSTTNEPTAEQKKAEAERLKREAEINAKKTNIENKNAVRQAALKEGSEAFAARNYDVALAKFDEGYKADTEFIGSAPVFLTAKGKVLSSRAVDKFNKSNKLEDINAKIEAMNGVVKDFNEAVDNFKASWTMLKNAPAASIPDQKNYDTNKSEVLSAIATTFGYMVATEKVDPAKTVLIRELTQEYLSVETDAAKKLKAQMTLADIYRISGDSDNAIIEYKKALEMSPDNPDALAGLGLSLFNSGEINNNVAQKQEGLGYMERFTQVAPDEHKLKASVAEAVAYLKSQKITPQKVTTTKKKP